MRSVVGRFLEHSRIFVFGNGGRPEVYLGSADWMPRNLYERVEVMFRLKDPALCHKVCAAIVAPYLADTEKARLLRADGEYVRAHGAGRAFPSSNGTRFGVQDFLIELAEECDEADVSELTTRLLSRLSKPHSPALAELLSLKWSTEPDAPEVSAPAQ